MSQLKFLENLIINGIKNLRSKINNSRSKTIPTDLILTKIEKLYILKERAIKTWQKEIDLSKK
jgi:hypothetical protein